MIPDNITRDAVLKAIAEIDAEGIPLKRNSRSYHLVLNGKEYPPKYVITIANKYVNGYELPHGQFSGGKQTNDFLRNLGFAIVS